MDAKLNVSIVRKGKVRSLQNLAITRQFKTKCTNKKFTILKKECHGISYSNEDVRCTHIVNLKKKLKKKQDSKQKEYKVEGQIRIN